ncbi:MAG: hypothetical protein HY683_06725 [Chloroflexi bacterium]|nr:hypothetical protein [Chloroflexota bacterium]
MTGKPRFMGLNEFVEELERTLSHMPLKDRYRDREEFSAHVAAAVKGFLPQSLGLSAVSYELWQGVAEDPAERGMRPTVFMGHDLVPSAVVDVAGRPTLALVLDTANTRRAAADKLLRALGSALVLCHQYPSVLVFLYFPSTTEVLPGLLEREVALGLWSQRKIRLLLRSH